MCNKQNLCIVVENVSLINEGYTIVKPKQYNIVKLVFWMIIGTLF